MSTKYYLFGEHVCKTYHNDSFDAVLKLLSEDSAIDASITSFNTKKDDPTDLLSAFQGWAEFAEITKEQFHEIKNIINKRS